LDRSCWSFSIPKYNQLELLKYLHGSRFSPRRSVDLKIDLEPASEVGTFTPIEETKFCNFCGLALALSSFDNSYKGNKTYKRNRCRKCSAKKGESYKKFIRRAHTKLKHARKKQGKEWDLTPEILFQIYEEQDGKCYLSGRCMSHTIAEGVKDLNISIDRIDPDKGYTKENISLCCVRANLIKHTLTNSELKDWTRAIWQHLQNDKNYS